MKAGGAEQTAVLAYAVLGLLGLFVLTGCREGLAPEKPPLSAPLDAKTAMEGRGLDLRMFDNNPTPGGPRKPTFWAHVNTFSQTNEDGWAFEEARAVIYGSSEGAEAIVLEAGSGRFQATQMAYLTDGVVARVGEMQLELTDIEWRNEERLAQTDSPVAISGGDCALKASSLRMYPDQKQLILTDVSGTLRLRRNEQ